MGQGERDKRFTFSPPQREACNHPTLEGPPDLRRGSLPQRGACNHPTLEGPPDLRRGSLPLPLSLLSKGAIRPLCKTPLCEKGFSYTTLIRFFKVSLSLRKKILKIRKELKNVESNLEPSPNEISLLEQIKALRTKILDQIHNNQAIKKNHNNRSCLPPPFTLEESEPPKKRLMLEEDNSYD